MGFLRSRRKGLSLSETAIAFGIAGIVFAAIWAAASSVNRKTQVEQVVSQMNAIAQNFRALYTGQYSNTTLPTQTQLICAGVFPPSALDKPALANCASATPAGPWGMRYGVAFNAFGGAGSAEERTFTVGIAPVSTSSATPLTAETCLTMASRLNATYTSQVGTSTSVTSVDYASVALSGGVTLPVIKKSAAPPMQNDQKDAPLRVYISVNGTWKDVTGQEMGSTSLGYFSGGASCKGVAAAFSL